MSTYKAPEYQEYANYGRRPDHLPPYETIGGKIMVYAV